MEFFDLVNISERYMELVNPSTPEKILTLGRFLRLQPNSRIIDFGCGYAEPLILWAHRYGVTGIGLELREYACHRAKERIAVEGLSDRLSIECGNAAEFPFAAHSFDAATCIGASFIWGGFRQTIQALSTAIKPAGRLGIGEPYWLTSNVPLAYKEQNSSVLTESELLTIAQEEGFDLEYVVRASHDDWDRYEADNWHGLIRWIETHPDHPERAEVIAYLHKIQREYLQYGREYLGWAMYVLAPQNYD